ncbi:MAG: CocE/NonD family hydrolase [Bacteroidetes bacterium]|nr:CocE/NonD family hydrolase [Bacteroidota bacterium]HET6244268.1 CocE/NonD family hydrolase [Bacteroidia bacterium]
MKCFFALIFSCSCLIGFTQSNNNGKLDLISEFTTLTTVPFTMPDGVQLMTDVYLPITSDSLTIDLNFLGSSYNLQIIPKGLQLFVYDSLNGHANFNKYRLPLVFTRTPYNKGSNDLIALAMNILGYAYVLQDLRGRYQSQGVYFPMYSDGWKKDSYHPNQSHILDVTSLTDQNNCLFHEDGKNSILFIMDSLLKKYDLDKDGIDESEELIYNGSIAMFGGSALGNTQYQAASSIKNNTALDGLKGLIPIVATAEYFNSTVQHNGVFRRGLMAGWIENQMKIMGNINPDDTDIQNAIHSNFDYGMLSSEDIINLAIDQFSTIPDENGYSAIYPNYQNRSDMDASYAPVDNNGESALDGQFNRYTNMELPVYHLTGWWDIFIDGQINTYNNIMNHTSLKTQSHQKIIIGPWTHGTIGRDTVTDQVFPKSVFDLSIAGKMEIASIENIAEVFKGEVASWLRYLLNYDSTNFIGEPKVLIPKSKTWQNIGNYSFSVPSKDYYLSYSDFLNFITGQKGLAAFPIEIQIDGNTFFYEFNIPIDSFQPPGSKLFSDPVVPFVDFAQIPNVRFYIPGPINDGIIQNNYVGNYWVSSDHFPLTQGVSDYTLYLHGDGSLDLNIPKAEEIPNSYVHDPDSPVYTVGGGNLDILTPKKDRENAGPMNYNDPELALHTMDRPDVLHFETTLFQDTLTIVGIPKAKIYISSLPHGSSFGPTDTDFFVRIIDVYPDGREYFVVEGAINARARDYAKSLAQANENITLPYTNINSGEIYELEFNLLPIAYCFGFNHKLKVLISSSNWPRYQSNPNLPIENGAFFRREPKDGKPYVFNGTEMFPRKATQKVYFSPDKPSQIILPFYSNLNMANEQEKKIPGPDFSLQVYPNPTLELLNIQLTRNGNYTCIIYNLMGQELLLFDIVNSKQANINMKGFQKGIYTLIVVNQNQQQEITKVVVF